MAEQITFYLRTLRVLIGFATSVTIVALSGCAIDQSPSIFDRGETIFWPNQNVGAAETSEKGGHDRVVYDSTDETAISRLDKFLNSVETNNIDSTTTVEVDQSDSFLTTSSQPNWITCCESAPGNAWAILMNDQRQFYRLQNLKPAAGVLGSSAILGNTEMDQEFSDWYQNDVRTDGLDDIAEVAKVFGEQWPMMGAYASASIAGRVFDIDPRLSIWGDRSIRSMLVGVPPLLFLQKAIGSSRPNDVPPSSDWDFWGDDNGASGHTFVGAVPFLVAAQMAETRGAKATWTALSMLPGWSRINDNDHYLSQVIVGWWLAYASTRAVEDADCSAGFEIAPTLINDSIGVEATWQR